MACERCRGVKFTMCRNCGGTGTLAVRDFGIGKAMSASCMKCLGTGRIPYICPYCNEGYKDPEIITTVCSQGHKSKVSASIVPKFCVTCGSPVSIIDDHGDRTKRTSNSVNKNQEKNHGYSTQTRYQRQSAAAEMPKGKQKQSKPPNHKRSPWWKRLLGK